MAGEESYPCKGCGRDIDPDGPETIKTMSLIRTRGQLQAEVELVEGEGALFHPACWAAADQRRFRRL